MANQFFTYPAVNATTSSPSTGPINTPSPLQATLVGGRDASTILRALLTDSTGQLQVVTTSSVLPTGGATAANQMTMINNQLDVAGAFAGGTAANKSLLTAGLYLTALPALTNGQQSGFMLDSSARMLISPLTTASIINVNDISGTISLPTGASTSALQTQISAQLPTTLGQKAIAASLAVAIASDQTAIPSSQSGTWNINNITGTVSLPTGASTSALQTTGNTSLATIATNTTGLNATIAATASAVPADAIQIGVKNGSNLVPITEGQATMANSLPVAIASDQGALPAKTQDGAGNAITSHLINSNRGLDEYTIGFTQANAPVYNDYTSTAITTGAYVQLIASTTSTTQEIEIFDSSGQALYLATGAAASEVNQLIIVPGGNGRIKFSIAAGTRVSAKAITATANVGFLAINLYG